MGGGLVFSQEKIRVIDQNNALPNQLQLKHSISARKGDPLNKKEKRKRPCERNKRVRAAQHPLSLTEGFLKLRGPGKEGWVGNEPSLLQNSGRCREREVRLLKLKGKKKRIRLGWGVVWAPRTKKT